jgi:MFS family permease
MEICFSLSVSLFLSLFSTYLISPFAQSQLQDADCDILCAGRLLMIRSLCSLVVGITLGYFSDCYGRKTILLVGLVATLLSHVIIILLGPTILSLSISAVLSSLNQNPAISKAFFADYSNHFHLSDAFRQKYVGYVGTAAGLAYMIAPAIGPQFASSSQEILPYSVLVSLLSISTLLYTIRSSSHNLFDPSPSSSQSTSSLSFTSSSQGSVFSKNPSLVCLLLFVRFLMALAYGLYNLSISFYFSCHLSFTPLNFSLYMLWIGFTYTLSQAFLGRYLISCFQRLFPHSLSSYSSSSLLLILCSLLIAFSRYLTITLPPCSASDSSAFLFSSHHLLILTSVLIANTSLGIINLLISLMISKITYSTGTLYGVMESIEKVSSGIIGPSLVGYLHLQNEIYPVRCVALIYIVVAALFWIHSRGIDEVLQEETETPKEIVMRILMDPSPESLSKDRRERKKIE